MSARFRASSSSDLGFLLYVSVQKGVSLIFNACVSVGIINKINGHCY